jgi:hypothetical protein
MDTTTLLSAIDQEIARLTEARSILAGNSRGMAHVSIRRRNLSPEARKRIAEAQKRRWAAVRSKAQK